jgi:hypothetical protein
MSLAKTMPRIVEGGCRVWMVIVNGESAAETPLILSAQSGLVCVGRGPRRQRTGSPWQYNDWRFRRAFVRLSKLHGVDARLALDGPCRPRLHNASAGGKTGMAGLPIALSHPACPTTCTCGYHPPFTPSSSKDAETHCDFLLEVLEDFMQVSCRMSLACDTEREDLPPGTLQPASPLLRYMQTAAVVLPHPDCAIT